MEREPDTRPVETSAGTTDDVTEAAINRGVAEARDSRVAISTPTGAPLLGAQPSGAAKAARERDLARIQPGWPVFGSDGALLGPVGGVGAQMLTITGASANDRDMYIPVDLIESVTEGRVVLNRPRPLLLDMKLDEAPAQAAVEIEGQRETGATAPSRLERELPRPAAPGASPAANRAPTVSRPDAVPPAPYAAQGEASTMRDAGDVPVVEDLREPNSLPTTTGAEQTASGVTWARETAPEAGSGHARFVLDSHSLDESDGPTHQPSVAPGYEPVRGQPTEYAPYRSPQERNEPDLDFDANREPAVAPPSRGGVYAAGEQPAEPANEGTLPHH